MTFNHLALSVKDVNRSAEFYTTVLGLTEITNKTRMEGIRWFSLGEGKELHLISLIKDTVVINKAVHLALTTNNFDALLKNIDRKQNCLFRLAGHAQQSQHPCRRHQTSIFQDPDGYWVEVNSVGQE